MHAFHQAGGDRGDAAHQGGADLQDPPERIADIVREWESGCSVVPGVQRASAESRLMFWIRKHDYRLVNQLPSIRDV